MENVCFLRGDISLQYWDNPVEGFMCKISVYPTYLGEIAGICSHTPVIAAFSSKVAEIVGT